MQKSIGRLAIVILAATLFGACNYLQVLQPPDDQAITTEVQAKLFADPVLKSRDIRVTSSQGVVTLSGIVSTELEKAAAVRLAGEAKGVKQVLDQLTVQVTPAAATPAPEMLPAEAAAAAPTAAPPAPAKPARRGERAAAPPVAETPAPAEVARTPEPAAPAPPAEAAAPPPPQPVEVTIPAGTVITVRMIDEIDSARHRAGEEFAASVDAPVLVGERVVIPRGSDARVRLAQAASAGRMTGRSELQVELVSLAVGSQTYSTETATYEKAGASRGKRTAATVGGGAALGALIGAVAGKGKGAAIGAAVGAGAGTAVQAATKGQQVQIPSETKLDFTLKAPITLRF